MRSRYWSSSWGRAEDWSGTVIVEGGSKSALFGSVDAFHSLMAGAITCIDASWGRLWFDPRLSSSLCELCSSLCSLALSHHLPPIPLTFLLLVLHLSRQRRRCLLLQTLVRLPLGPQNPPPQRRSSLTTSPPMISPTTSPASSPSPIPKARPKRTARVPQCAPSMLLQNPSPLSSTLDGRLPNPRHQTGPPLHPQPKQQHPPAGILQLFVPSVPQTSTSNVPRLAWLLSSLPSRWCVVSRLPPTPPPSSQPKYNAALGLLQDMHPALISLYHTITYRPALPILDLLALPLPDDSISDLHLNLISTYLLHALQVLSHTTTDVSSLISALNDLSSPTLLVWAPALSNLPDKQHDHLFTRAYTITSRLASSIATPSPAAYSLRIYSLLCLSHARPSVIAPSAFWEQAVKFTAVFANTDCVSPDDAAQSVSDSCARLVAITEKRQDRSQFMTGVAFARFCEYWSRFAKQVGAVPPLLCTQAFSESAIFYYLRTDVIGR